MPNLEKSVMLELLTNYQLNKLRNISDILQQSAEIAKQLFIDSSMLRRLVLTEKIQFAFQVYSLQFQL